MRLSKKLFSVSGKNFHVQVIYMQRVLQNDVWNFDSQVCDTLWIQDYRMRSYVEHETTNYREATEVDRAITT